MVFLKDLKTQWPWNVNAVEDLHDKEIFTQFVYPDDASKTWRISIEPPLSGFVYVGIRVYVEELSDTVDLYPRLVMGMTYNSVFGTPWDILQCPNKQWHPLGFPLTHRMIAQEEDGMDFVIRHERSCYGKVELLAQKLDDFMENESTITYAFLDDSTKSIAWIMTPSSQFYHPHSLYYPFYEAPVKLVPPLSYLLDKNQPEWDDTSLFQTRLNLISPMNYVI